MLSCKTLEAGVKKYLFLLMLITFFGCNTEYTNYYYGKENIRAFLCSWDHYIVAKDLGDSLQIWNLDDECNAGYWTRNNMTIIKAPGNYGSLTVTSVSDKEIILTLESEYKDVEFNLRRQTETKKSFRVINIIQMLEIDEKMEKYIQSESLMAEKNTFYLTENYIADSKVEILSPKEFYRYYSNKKKAKADEIISKLNK